MRFAIKIVDPTPPTTSGGRFGTTVPATTATTNKASTDSSHNIDSLDHALVYEIAPNEYIIAFEDWFFASSDRDYNDIVVRVKFS